MEKEGTRVLNALRLEEKIVVLLAPSFVAEFSYPEIVLSLKKAGFDKVVELTFGAKLVNKEYHKLLACKNDCFWISSVCPGIVEIIKNKYPKYKKNLMPIISPMIATARLCKIIYPTHKTLFISPCNMKKIEAKNNKKDIDFVLDYQELRELFKDLKIDLDKKIKPGKKENIHFDKFYNDYTKIYPLAGGLSKTAHLKGIVGANDTEIIDGLFFVEKFLQNPDKTIKFLDANFCIGGCIGGPCLSKSLNLEEKKRKVIKYVKKALHETIPKADKGILKKSENLSLEIKY
jgi:iron only hydrogenase large subunit-like protein